MTSKVSAKKAQNQQSPVSQSYQVISSCIPDWHDSYLSSCHWADRIPNLAISSGRCEQMDMGWTSSSSVEGDGEGFGGLWICDCRERWLCPQKARVHKQIGYCWTLIMPDTQQCRECHNGFPLSWASRLHCKKPHYDTVSPWINQRKWSSYILSFNRTSSWRLPWLSFTSMPSWQTCPEHDVSRFRCSAFLQQQRAVNHTAFLETLFLHAKLMFARCLPSPDCTMQFNRQGNHQIDAASKSEVSITLLLWCEHSTKLLIKIDIADNPTINLWASNKLKSLIFYQITLHVAADALYISIRCGTCSRCFITYFSKNDFSDSENGITMEFWFLRRPLDRRIIITLCLGRSLFSTEYSRSKGWLTITFRAIDAVFR